MKKFKLFTAILFLLATSAIAQSQMPLCTGKDAKRWTNCQGIHNFTNGDRYEGEFKDGKPDGSGTYYHLSNNQYQGDKYSGQFLAGSRHGAGLYTSAKGGETQEGIWKAGVFVRTEKVKLLPTTDFSLLEERKRIKEEESLAAERRLADERLQMKIWKEKQRKEDEVLKKLCVGSYKFTVREMEWIGKNSLTDPREIELQRLEFENEVGSRCLAIFYIPRGVISCRLHVSNARLVIDETRSTCYVNK
jgi:hypothetical protein